MIYETQGKTREQKIPSTNQYSTVPQTRELVLYGAPLEQSTPNRTTLQGWRLERAKTPSIARVTSSRVSLRDSASELLYSE